MSALPEMPLSTHADPALTVELWLDIGCPWCYLGRHRLDQAVAATGGDARVPVVLRSFELNPGMSTEPIPVPEYLAGKFAGTVARAREADAQVAALAEADGLPYTSERQIANTVAVHRVLHLAREHGVANEMFGVLQRGYFAGELDPFDQETLVRTAIDAGVPAEQARTALAGSGYAESVRQELAQGRALGITGVPVAVLGGRYAVAGAQSVDAYATAIRTALAEPA